MWSFRQDLKALPLDLIEDLKVVGGKKFQEKIQYLLQAEEEKILPYPDKGGRRIRKLVWFPDREDKVRIIAILDYFSQSVLKGFHKYLFKILKRIPQDCTFSQGSFKNDTSFMSNDLNEVYVSADLSSATDRFPISLIGDVLKGRLPDHYINS